MEFIEEFNTKRGYFYAVYWEELSFNNPKDYCFGIMHRLFCNCNQEQVQDLLGFVIDNDLPIEYLEDTELFEIKPCLIDVLTTCAVAVGPLDEYQAILFKLRYSEQIYINE
jgi:hypothetical protein